MKIGLIGCGNMALAIIKGMTQSGVCIKEDILISDVSIQMREKARQECGVCIADGNAALAKEAEIIFLTVKPGYYEPVISEIRDVINTEKLVITVAAGKTLDWLEKAFDKPVPIVRTMPNTPAMVSEGMTAICHNEYVREEGLFYAMKLLRSFGRAELVPEQLFDAVTAVSGSSPAYVYMLIEAMADAAVAEGMPRNQAYTFAAQAVYGSAKMVLETGMHPGVLKDMVCSPGGTTIEAVAALKESGYEGSVIKAMKVCAEKSKKMSG